MYLSPFPPIRALSALLIAVLAASCAPPVEEPLPVPKPVIPPVQEPPAEAETQTAPVHIILESQIPRPDPPATAGTVADLEDSAWQVGEYRFVFHSGGHVIVEGGNFSEIAPNGVPARIVIKEGVVDLRMAGRQSWGIWDGTTLVIGDTRAKRLKVSPGDTQ